jgi:hypothetical protein
MEAFRDQFSGPDGFSLREKMIAARTRIWASEGHYMGFNLGLFLQMGGFNGLDFGGGNRRVL